MPRVTGRPPDPARASPESTPANPAEQEPTARHWNTRDSGRIEVEEHPCVSLLTWGAATFGEHTKEFTREDLLG